MKRVLKIREARNEYKYEFIEEYDGYAIYERVAPCGCFISQEWAVLDLENDNPAPIIIESYNHISKAEILDAIDERNENGAFGWRVFWKPYGVVVHPSGNGRI
jgi:hypothetical protein